MRSESEKEQADPPAKSNRPTEGGGHYKYHNSTQEPFTCQAGAFVSTPTPRRTGSPPTGALELSAGAEAVTVFDHGHQRDRQSWHHSTEQLNPDDLCPDSAKWETNEREFGGERGLNQPDHFCDPYSE